ncbi:zinc-ribbon domain-containing protein [Oceanobacillus sp. J11TS1]|uniref:TcaA NTF2-like domain-containing protein n=1 Tax=Oceanobacillus sp. J11TS1 TaxID=2807191 RepID=UPI001B19C978|nr:zinc-ribbon domain-containing protein [Oceanobacillus sp. J11TS1]GIO24519.1 hypothetical protein J11TS1_31000 [Oceanobacillus sp. J11TS1]
MRNFCKECGKAVSETMRFCKHCGTEITRNVPKNEAPLQKTETHAENNKNNTQNQIQTRKTNKGKKVLSKKQKIMTGLFGLLLLGGLGFVIWGNYYYSEANTVKRFRDAFVEGEAGTLQKMVTVQGNTISKEEAEAITHLLTEDDDYDFEFIKDKNPEKLFEELPVFKVAASNKKALLFFDQYEIEAEPQYVSIYSDVQGVETTFNEKEFPMLEEARSYTEYGPLAPGVYEAKSAYQTDFGKVDNRKTVVLLSSENEYESEVEVSEVTLSVSKLYELPYDSIQFMINEEKVDIDMEDDDVTVGPLPLDGSMELTGVAKTGWGEVNIGPIALTESYQDVEMDLLNDQLKEAMSQLILSFSEDYVEALAQQDASAIENISGALQETLDYDLFSYTDGNGFSGSLDEVGISFTDMIEVEDNVYEIPVQIKMTGTYDKDGDPEEIKKDAVFQLQYNKNNGEWNVFYFNESYYTTGSNLEFYEVSGEEHQGVTADDSDEEADSEEEELAEIEVLVENYVYDLVDAINAGDYSLVEGNIAPGSDFDTMQKDLVARLYDAGLTQEVLSAAVVDMTEIDSGEWEVTTNETIVLNYSSGETETEDYQWVYTIELTEDGYKITNLE